MEFSETLSKDLIFSRALSSLKEQLDEAQDVRENLISKTKSNEQVRHFLQVRLKSFGALWD
jgi:hypothetical protein